jgi:hypothetical protein
MDAIQDAIKKADVPDRNGINFLIDFGFSGLSLERWYRKINWGNFGGNKKT